MLSVSPPEHDQHHPLTMTSGLTSPAAAAPSKRGTPVARETFHGSSVDDPSVEAAPLPAVVAKSSIFLEIVRDDRDQSLTLHFRRKGRPVDGQAFFCLCRADAASDPSCLFQRLAGSTSALKRFAVQSDMFHHTGVLECGYCTVTASVGSSKLHRIHPNVPYLVALTIHGEQWTKRALGGGSPAVMAEQQAFVLDCRQQPAIVAQTLGDDPFPYVEKAVLRELKDQGSRIRPAFHVFGRSPWNDNLIPSLECVRYLSIMVHNFFSKNSIHLQPIGSNGSKRRASSPSADHELVPKRHGASLLRGSGGGRSTVVRRPMLQRQLVIHGVADPLCGALVSFLLAAMDAVQKFRIKAPPTSQGGLMAIPNSGSRTLRLECQTDGIVSGSPRGPLPNAGDLLDAVSALGSRVQSTSSLSSSWLLDWYDILLLCTVDAPSLKRISQAALQFKSYDVEGQHIQARLLWMLRPEKQTPPRGTLAKLLIEEATRLDLEKMNPTTRGSGSYVPCVLSPGRAIWTWMPHRQQLRAMFYTVALPTLSEAVQHARKHMLNPSLVQPMYRRNRREHARRRLSSWVQFVTTLRERRAMMLERQYSQSSAAPLILSLVARAETALVEVYLTKWLRHRIVVKFVAPMQSGSASQHLRYRFRIWRIATTRQYNIRVPQHLTMAARGAEGLLPMPRVWIRRLEGVGFSLLRNWNVLFDLGDGNGTQTSVVSDLQAPQQQVVGTVAESAEQRRRRRRRMPTLITVAPHQSFCGVNVKLYVMLHRLTEQRDKFHAYRLWRAFAEIARHYRRLQVQQIKAIHALEAFSNSSSSTRRVLFADWRRWALHRHHQRTIVQESDGEES